jgi:hypothetical protein
VLRKKRLAGRIAPTLTILALLAAAGGVQAQGAPPPNARQACRASALSLCRPEIGAHDMAGVRACLVRNFDKVSPDCQAAMKAVRDRQGDPDAQAAPGPGPADTAPGSGPPPQSPPPHR